MNTSLKIARILALAALAQLAFLSPVSAATNDTHFYSMGANGQLNEVIMPAGVAGAIYTDGNGNYSFVPIPTNVPVLSSGDFTVTTAGLTAGTGTLALKFTMQVTFTTAFAQGVVPEVTVITHGLCAYGDATNITNTGFTLVLPASVAGTFGYIAAKKQ